MDGLPNCKWFCSNVDIDGECILKKKFFSVVDGSCSCAKCECWFNCKSCTKDPLHSKEECIFEFDLED